MVQREKNKSSVWVAEWPSFRKKLPTWLAMCSHCILSICNFSYFPFWLWEQGLVIDCPRSFSLLMPRLHLPWTPHGLFAYNFPYCCSGIERGYGICVYVCMAIMQYQFWVLGNGPSRTVDRLMEIITEIMRPSCNLGSPAQKITWISYGSHVAFIRRLCRDCTVAVLNICSFSHLCTKHVQRLMIDMTP